MVVNPETKSIVEMTVAVSSCHENSQSKPVFIPIASQPALNQRLRSLHQFHPWLAQELQG